MNDTEARALLVEILRTIAPETDPASLAGEEDIREALDIDSMDFLNFATALAARTGREIPEADYPCFFTMDGAVAWLRG
ncbi:acyl carrier protein [Geminicoccaceae bacterium 1502E]|nr:acyl carrier protein [Geminicoccaceae bacterium 1502E]